MPKHDANDRFKTKPAPKRKSSNMQTRVFGDRLLDARRDRLDFRDRIYVPPLASLKLQFPDDATLDNYLQQYTKAELVLDQGTEGACTGFGLACVINYLTWISAGMPAKPDKVSERMIYHLARLYDEWPGEDYEGSSCRGALKGWHKHGVCSNAHWPYRSAKNTATFVSPKPGWAEDALKRLLGVYYRVDSTSIVDMQAAIAEIGAVYVSANVHKGWRLPTIKRQPTFANLPIIGVDGSPITGGHAFALVGYDARGFVVQNSWGRNWGLEGFGILTYDDWLQNGLDCWAVALGVPGNNQKAQEARDLKQPAHALPRKAYFKPRAASGAPRALQVLLSSSDDQSASSDRLSTEEAYYRSVVLGNEGTPLLRIVEHENGVGSVGKVAHDIPASILAGRDEKHVLLFAHGGLNDEAVAIERNRILGRLFERNGIHPLFLTWRTGPIETICNIVSDELAKALRPFGDADLFETVKRKASETKDRFLEVVARGLVAKAMWDQMKQNAEAANIHGGGGMLTAGALRRLYDTANGKLKLHLVGHSAGSIILGHMLKHLPPVASCTLLAPACTVPFANEHYGAAVGPGGCLQKSKLAINVLSDQRERDDSVGPYGKSLLYLVSRALETTHKMPLLGLEAAFDPQLNASAQWNTERGENPATVDALIQWQGHWQTAIINGNGFLTVEKRASIKVGRGRSAKAEHGSFDNNVDVLNAILERALGTAPPEAAQDLVF